MLQNLLTLHTTVTGNDQFSLFIMVKPYSFRVHISSPFWK